MTNTLLSKFKNLPLGFGGGAISGEGAGYGFGKITESEAIDLLKYSYDRGIRLFDTAPIYGFGTSEERIGKTFKSMRDKVFIVSKSGVDWHENKRVNMSNDPKITERMLNESLRRLQTEYIDLYMIHWPDPNMDIREPLEILKRAQEIGKIKHIGLCNTNLSDLEKSIQVARIEAVQSEFNYFNTQASELFPFLNKHQISFMNWGTLDKGILSGTVTANRKYDKVDARSGAPWWKKDLVLQKIKQVDEIKRKHPDLLRFAIEFIISQKSIDLMLIGFKSRKQLEEILKIIEKPQ